MTRIGYFLASEEHPPRELVRQARLAEQAGFEALWISDHYHPWLDEQAYRAPPVAERPAAGEGRAAPAAAPSFRAAGVAGDRGDGGAERTLRTGPAAAHRGPARLRGRRADEVYVNQIARTRRSSSPSTPSRCSRRCPADGIPVAFAIGQPDEADVGEIVVRPTAQS